MKKTILITGSTDGIGKLAAIKLAEEGHEIYVHGRNPEKLSSIIAEIRDLTKNEKIGGYVADFSNLGSVQKMAQRMNEEASKIDVLINNAGVYKSPAVQNDDGLDMRFVVNYLAPYVLTNELIPLLNKGLEPRVINLSSAAQATISYDVLSGKQQGSEGDTYAQSKLALTMWSFYLAKNNPEISVIAVNPGSLLNTKMVQEAYGKFWSSANKGADILYELAVSETYAGVTGKYFDNDQGSFNTAHPDAYNENEIDKLINATNNILAR